jgi:hypothetical protein
MDWLASIDGYCERQSPAYWAEPVNALTNLAFVIAALVMWQRSAGLGPARALCAVLAAIGIGSFLFHTHANRLTAMLDVLPIVIFILVYVFFASRDFLALKPWQASLCTLGFLPYAALTGAAFSRIPGLGASAAYAPVPLLILIFAAATRFAPQTSRGLVIGAALLVVSLTFRTLDQPLCDVLPIGTHFGWHILNGLMLAWMIEVYRRHRLAAARSRG